MSHADKTNDPSVAKPASKPSVDGAASPAAPEVSGQPDTRAGAWRPADATDAGIATPQERQPASQQEPQPAPQPAVPPEGQPAAQQPAATGQAPAAAAQPPIAPPQSDAQQKLSEFEAKHAEVAEAYLRAKADAENTRRRAEEEMSKARKFAVEAFAESLLPVKDSLEAAIANPSASPEQMLEGVHATLRQLSAALERNKVIEINPPQGTKFDPHQHQAISLVNAPQDPNTVVAVLQKGYLIAERVLRPALVTVAAPR